MRRFFLPLSVLAVALAVAVPVGISAVGVDSSALREAVTVEGILEHQAAFQEFANLSVTDPDFGFPTRVDGSVGFTESVAYVAARARAAGYLVTVQPFTFDRFVEESVPVFERVSPQAKSYVADSDFLTMEYSGSGDVTAPIFAVGGIVLDSPGGAASGCSAADYNGIPLGAIALIQRGTCTFREKAQLALDAGAGGVIIFNEGDTEERSGVISGTLDPPQMSLPVIGTSYAVGVELLNLLKTGAVTVHLEVDATVIPTESANVIADSPTGRADRTVVVGAHLDSVTEGPGINDNGSGSAAILEIAEEMSALGIEPRNRVRFAWWGGEEFGLLGADYYLSQLETRDLKDIAVNLNFDMVGSPNFVRFVYDGNGSSTGTKGPTGSGNVEQVFLDYFAQQGLPTEPTEFDGRSDYGPFIDRGIPAGGLFTGAEGIKTADEASIYGGTAGVAYDACYHQACDDLDNLSTVALDQMSDAAADAVLQFAMTTSAVSGTGQASSKAKATTEFKGSSLRK